MRGAWSLGLLLGCGAPVGGPGGGDIVQEQGETGGSDGAAGGPTVSEGADAYYRIIPAALFRAAVEPTGEGPFVPGWWAPTWHFAIREGELGLFTDDGAEHDSSVVIMLTTEDYPDTYDPADTCYAFLDFETKVDLDEGWPRFTGQMGDWWQTSCELDPAWTPEALDAALAGRWELELEPLGGSLGSSLQAELGADYTTLESSLYGVEVSWQGQDLAALNGLDQIFWGYAEQLDEDGIVTGAPVAAE